jgi:S-adenosylmethionine/arginine decarboxylase-like enzyme
VSALPRPALAAALAAALGGPGESGGVPAVPVVAAPAAAPVAAPARTLDETVADAVTKGVAFLRSAQEEDGSFGAPRNVMFNESFATVHTYEAWTYATTGLCAMALADCGKSAEDTVCLDRAVDGLLKRPLPKRVSEWDTDNVWAYVYGVQALAYLLPMERFAKDPRRPAMVARATDLIAQLERWQTPFGGWAYYDTDATTIPPVWTTSFTTAAAVIGLLDAEKAGLPVNQRMLNKALACVDHARLPTGAYTYNISTISSPANLEFIDQVKGSLGRIQVGNVALMRGGLLDAKTVKAGLEQFFENHRFLAVARKKPIPHESWYAVAAYFFLFGHYYASEAIDLLPVDQRAPFAKQLQQKLLEIQEDDGAFWDFHISEYTRAYGTAFAILALQRTRRATSGS